MWVRLIYTLTGGGRLPDPDPVGPATVFSLPTVGAARHGGAAVGDVRGQVARFWSGRPRPRRVWVGDQQHERHGAS